MSSVSIGFPFGGLGKPKLYQNMWCFTMCVGFYLEGVWLWRVSGGGQSHNWVCDWPF